MADAASGSSLQDAPVPQESCMGTVLPAKGIKGRAIKNKEGIRVEAVFYLGADTVSFSAQTDYHGRFSLPLPPGCHGRVKVGFRTYRGIKSMGYLVELDRDDGRKAVDRVLSVPQGFKDADGNDVYVFDMQREAELEILRGREPAYMPLWLVKQPGIRERYRNGRRALAWSENRFSVFKCPLFNIRMSDEHTAYRVIKYHYNLLEERYVRPDFANDSEMSGILELGGPRVMMNNIDKLYVSTADYDMYKVCLSREDSEETRRQMRENLARFKPMQVSYKRLLPMVYVDNDTFYTFVDAG